MFDLLAIVLAIVAIAYRWYDHPKAAALCGYGSALCAWVAARRWRARERAHAE